MKIYRCKYLGLEYLGTWRVRVEMIDDHVSRDGRKGEVMITSALRSIDLERGIAVTQNSTYIWDV